MSFEVYGWRCKGKVWTVKQERGRLTTAASGTGLPVMYKPSVNAAAGPAVPSSQSGAVVVSR